MALHDVDGSIEAVDINVQRPSLGAGLVSPVIEGQDVGKVITKTNQIIVNDGDNDRILIGFGAGLF